jgi:outer membrane lipoprotein-sorting protein
MKYASLWSMIFGLTATQALADSSTKNPTNIDYNQVVTDAERIRSVEPAEVKVNLVTEAQVAGKTQLTNYEMTVQRGKGKKAYVRFTAPSEELGRQMLVIGDQYWARFPDSQKVHKISRKEMIGNSVFQLVDLFQMDVKNDYNAKLIGRENISGIECYNIELTPKTDDAAYARVEYLIAIQDHFPMRAKFFSASGKHLRTLEITGRKTYSGVARPEGFVMTDEVTKGRFSRWTTKSIKEKSISDNVFSKDFLLSH